MPESERQYLGNEDDVPGTEELISWMDALDKVGLGSQNAWSAFADSWTAH